MELVAGVAPALSDSTRVEEPRVVIGTLGRSRTVDALVDSDRLDASEIAGRWEAFLIRQVGGDLVVAGSDPRGTIYGVYEAGMRVPDDVILLWCDDNRGNIRRLPTPDEMRRSGGAGVYYHFDYVGGPRNYKWINVTLISKV